MSNHDPAVGDSADVDRLIAEIQDTLGRVQAKRKSAQKRARSVFLAQVLLIFLTTVLLGLRWPENETALNNAALVTSAGATLVATISGYFNYRDRWVEHTRMASELRGLLGDANALKLTLSGVPEQQSTAELRMRLRRLLDQSTQRWVEIKHVEPTTPPVGDSGKK